MTVVYLVRHADPDRSTGVPYTTLPGPGLTSNGIGEARLLGRFLKTIDIQVIWCSPMSRTHLTAALAMSEMARLGKQEPFFATTDRLIESQPGESTESIRARMLEAMHEAMQWSGVPMREWPGLDVALVTHGGPMAVLLEALGMPDAELIAHMASCDNGSPLPTAGVMRCTWTLGDDWRTGWSFELVFDPRRAEDRAGVGAA